LDFRELKYLLLVAKTKNITRAAELLHISQPSLSQFIRKVERDMGCELFRRSSRGLEATPAGEEYIRSAKEILMRREELRQRIDDLSHMRRGKLTLGITTQRGGYIVPDVVSVFKRKHPGIELKIRERLSTDELEEMALEGECDIFISSLPLKHSELHCRVLMDDCIYLVLPPSFPLPHAVFSCTPEEKLDFIRSLRDEDFIVPPQKMKLGRLVRSLFVLLGFEPRVMLETHSVDTAQYIVLGGSGITFAFRSVFLDYRMREKPIYIPIDDPRFKMQLGPVFPIAVR